MVPKSHRGKILRGENMLHFIFLFFESSVQIGKSSSSRSSHVLQFRFQYQFCSASLQWRAGGFGIVIFLIGFFVFNRSTNQVWPCWLGFNYSLQNMVLDFLEAGSIIIIKHISLCYSPCFLNGVKIRMVRREPQHMVPMAKMNGMIKQYVLLLLNFESCMKGEKVKTN